MSNKVKYNEELFTITKYPDGTSYVTLKEDIDPNYVEFAYRINSYEDLWQLGQITDVLIYNGIGAEITIPCLLDAQADRRFGDNQSSGLRLVMDFLNNIGADERDIAFNIFHPHNPEVVENMLKTGYVIDNKDFILDVLQSLEIYGEREAMGTILMSSDAGGFKPLMKLCDKLEWNGGTYSASKARKWDYGEQKSTLAQIVDREDFGGQDIIIVDDICVYGGTFKGLSKLLRERNVGKLYLAVSHMTIQGHKGDDTVFNYFDKVFTTNSKFDQYFMESSKGDPIEPSNLEIIKMF